MIWHISIFFVEKNDKYEKRIETLLEELKNIESEIKGKVQYFSGKNITQLPGGLEGMPVFGDCIQIILFDSKANADLYPSCDAHSRLQKKTGGFIEKIVAADLRIEA